MQYGSVTEFLNAIEQRIAELEEEEQIAASTSIKASSILSDDFTDDEYELFDSIIDEAWNNSEYTDEAQICDAICIKLSQLGYTDDEITRILDYAGL